MTKTVEIATAHNIVVSCELATLTDRILATMIDLALILLIVFFIATIGNSLSISTFSNILSFLTFSFYHLSFEVFNGGQSPGKKMMNIKVVNLKGASPLPAEAFQRWVFRTLDVTLSLGALASLYITSSSRNQRLGDMIAGTAVIKLQHNSDMNLNRVLRIQHKEREVQYPQVVNFREDDMLLVKEVLHRYGQFRNKSSEDALILLSEKVCEKMKIPNQIVDRKIFLEEVLKDYVFLTR